MKPPSQTYRARATRTTRVSRVANLKMDATGLITGQIDMTYAGPAALRWRHTALRGDDESLKHELRTSLEAIIPHTLEIKNVTVANINDYENPLKVTYTVEGTVGSWTGKRLVIPADLFLVNHKATFPHEKREIAVDFNYPEWTRDALRINFPSTFTIEAAPPTAKYSFQKLAAYGMTVESAPTSFTTRRDYAFGDVIVLPNEYSQLRTFYSQLETNDQQSIVLKSTGGATTTASTSRRGQLNSRNAGNREGPAPGAFASASMHHSLTGPKALVPREKLSTMTPMPSVSDLLRTAAALCLATAILPAHALDCHVRTSPMSPGDIAMSHANYASAEALYAGERNSGPRRRSHARRAHPRAAPPVQNR